MRQRAHGFFLIDNLVPGYYVVSFKKDGFAFGRFATYIPTLDEIEKASGIDLADTDTNTSIFLENDTDQTVANVSVSGRTYAYTALLEPVLFGRVAGLSGTILRQIRAEVVGTSDAVLVPSDGITEDSFIEFSAVTAADGSFSLPADMPAATADISTEAIYYPGDDLWYPATLLESAFNLRSGTAQIVGSIVPSVDRPLILGHTGDITAPMSVDQLLSVTFSIPMETLTAQIVDFYSVGSHLDFEVSLDPTREVATLFDPIGDFPDYDLGVQTVTLTGTAFSGEAIASTIQVYTPVGMNIVATNVPCRTLRGRSGESRHHRSGGQHHGHRGWFDAHIDGERHTC
jgi:hypothetical protein